jgi:hypothetical protein
VAPARELIEPLQRRLKRGAARWAEPRRAHRARELVRSPQSERELVANLADRDGDIAPGSRSRDGKLPALLGGGVDREPGEQLQLGVYLAQATH